MSVIFLLIPLAFLLAALAVWAFVRSAQEGQYDDLDTPAHRMLLDDDRGPATVPGPSSTRQAESA
ncbi:MAG: cbb3-type cytochrome oxidase assembly protein CcoS [Phycisphaerales bacterium]|nr:cbb3-type cytochrome oxidase assembly protein CcoS [Phycisphaerales bacterium]